MDSLTQLHRSEKKGEREKMKNEKKTDINEPEIEYNMLRAWCVRRTSLFFRAQQHYTFSGVNFYECS